MKNLHTGTLTEGSIHGRPALIVAVLSSLSASSGEFATPPLKSLGIPLAFITQNRKSNY